ncbi:uncharacterized protein BJ212DRAFT_452480 [Suillus subaureus]|uniref:Uncharacterized protein n=1 Tax=Suillus subaureus TaxID=48587 RepID=A0A9P7JBB4_9AGAM|nr:uncharacterized protein BJ212DRAFT_452480 [Suillus subaureus]KAG1812486.1 hypothetical protein BJ212DRAFT_452480 [Suillus subaureus]
MLMSCTPALSKLSGKYRTINQSLVDTEKLLHLLNDPTEVVDELDAKESVVSNGEVEFGFPHHSYAFSNHMQLATLIFDLFDIYTCCGAILISLGRISE